jgi:hypothetical protein
MCSFYYQQQQQQGDKESNAYPKISFAMEESIVA